MPNQRLHAMSSDINTDNPGTFLPVIPQENDVPVVVQPTHILHEIPHWRGGTGEEPGHGSGSPSGLNRRKAAEQQLYPTTVAPDIATLKHDEISLFIR
jgi:hypothetical protein